MQIAPTSPLSAAPASAVPSASVLSSDFETFLQMLTAQARYQDPLEPIDSSEYAAQLAQFSMVEQQVLSNDLLSALGAQIGSGNMGQLASWIGMDARTTAPVGFDGTPITVAAEPMAGADQAFLLVYDDSGQEIARQEITATAHQLSWSGEQSDGTPAPHGLYHFAIDSRALGDLLGSRAAQSYARVIEARREGNDSFLILQGGSKVATAEVTALRAPS